MVHTMKVLEEKLQFRRNEELKFRLADSVQFARTHGIDVPHKLHGYSYVFPISFPLIRTLPPSRDFLVKQFFNLATPLPKN